MKTILIAESDDRWLCDDWSDSHSEFRIMLPADYLVGEQDAASRGARVFNLCRSYSYQSLGYYVSLLAEARGHRAIPDVMTIQDLSGVAAVRLVPQSLETLVERSLAPLASDEFVLSVYFGENLAKKYARLARELHAVFQAPLLRFKFVRRSKWRLRSASAIALKDVPVTHREFVSGAARRYFSRSIPSRTRRKPMRYSLAILHNPDEGQLSPSDPLALKRMIKAAAAEGIETQMITAHDAGRLLEFDALFIRETTAVSHHTYRLARRAEAAGMVVIDDPLSILRCTNKVFLAELLERSRIPAPETVVIHRRNRKQVTETLAYPCVLKQPDSAFSRGVVKVNDPDEMKGFLDRFFVDSELVIAQEYVKTDFDWRIGLLDGRPLWACKYHMARGHWQIAKHSSDAKTRFGKCETLPIELAPRKCVALAEKAASLIGNGLYGVDIKETNGAFLVIEINDNPNLDSGVEDRVLRDELYRRVMESFAKRIERSKTQ